ncbi:hypothetical protein QWY85_04330 [Neolewinella lacunae]|uniref:DUF4340 domain-containing protein n=1 Tax=Neolewinella lacunae TaxID=1517758 RepID=A0A923PSN1_9BACT|nr:hypothetical protein [Neolewinella lacunae]MBC6996753.1 hypothetical protein [Neolewinella lacunae]MDN3633873.1 hypothetical protein [Neolewinella lacunae]
MRTLVPILLLACLGYAAWYYWQAYTDRPLREHVLLASPAEISSVSVQPWSAVQPFTVTRNEAGGWVVREGTIQVLDQAEKAEAFVEALAALRTDSVAQRFPAEELSLLTVHSEAHGAETFALARPLEGPALLRVEATGDVFALPEAALRPLLPALDFNYYRERRLLRLAPARVDSIVAWQRDSFLWRITGPAAALHAPTFIAPADAPYADHFDEIAHQDRYHATIILYAAGQPHRVTVFQDALWQPPWVLVGADFPRRFLGLDSLSFPQPGEIE